LRKAFTLIELLVVIAIIAILAAILFPVFAQAKLAAKKSVTVSNIKQQLTSVQIYMGDVDDVCPMECGVRPDGIGTWGSGVIHPVPYNVVTTAPWTLPARWLMAQCFWANATQPYSKSYGILEIPVGGKVNTVPDTFLAGVTPANVGLTYNGLFHQLNATTVNAPANAIMFWEDQNLNFIGRGLASPAINCSSLGAGPGALQGNPQPCVFSSGDTSIGGIYYVFDFTHSAWIFGNREVYGYADGHAKVGFVGLTIAPNVGAPSSSINDPLAQVTATGIPQSYWPCGSGGVNDFGPTAIYPCFFRPDRTW